MEKAYGPIRKWGLGLLLELSNTIKSEQENLSQDEIAVSQTGINSLINQRQFLLRPYTNEPEFIEEAIIYPSACISVDGYKVAVKDDDWSGGFRSYTVFPEEHRRELANQELVLLEAFEKKWNIPVTNYLTDKEMYAGLIALPDSTYRLTEGVYGVTGVSNPKEIKELFDQEQFDLRSN